jgi:RHS repeat-associated protein
MNLGRNSSFLREKYRYGFQNQEKDDEVKGEGNSVNYKYRMHDPRLGRFFAVDPLTKDYPHYSPYSFSGNIVIHNIELEGLENVHYYLQNEQGEWTKVPNWVDVYSDLDENVNCYLYTYPKGGVKKAVYKSIEQGGKDRWEHHGGTAPPELLRAHYDKDKGSTPSSYYNSRTGLKCFFNAQFYKSFLKKRSC